MRGALIVGALLSSLALAGTPTPTADEPAAPQDWFEVELIVFRHTQPGAGASETWPADPGRPAVEQALEFDGGVGTTASAAAGDSIAFTTLPPESSRLAAQWDKFVKSSRYEPIGYFAWIQPPLDRATAQSVRLALPLVVPNPATPYPAPTTAAPSGSSGAAAPPATDPPFAFDAAPALPLLPPLRTPLDGTATVGLARYLYLTLDLEFQPGDLPPLVDGTPAPPFRLTETRRMRSKELHYFDHPLFGVLALITPRPAPPETNLTPETHP